MSRSPLEGRAGVRHTPKRSNLIGQSWGAPFRPSVDFGPWDTTEIGCGPGTSASDMNLVVAGCIRKIVRSDCGCGVGCTL